MNRTHSSKLTSDSPVNLLEMLTQVEPKCSLRTAERIEERGHLDQELNLQNHGFKAGLKVMKKIEEAHGARFSAHNTRLVLSFQI